MEFVHKSVLLEEAIEALAVREDGIYVDGTLGGGGHSYEIACRLGPTGRLIGIDQDEAAIEAAGKRLAGFGSRVTIVRDNYVNFPQVMDRLGIEKVDGILLDIGVSSYQIDTADRGFSYMEDAPLDMRMDQRNSLTARIIVNEYTEEEIFHLIRDFGEDPFAKSIASHIVKARQKAPIETTGQLVDIIRGSVPAKVRNSASNPAKRTFQALRIECNRELAVLEESIDGMIACLNSGGRLAIITFHSLEDRIVKNKFRENENPCICPPNFPVCVCGRKSRGHVVTRKPVIPSPEEQRDNKRAKSAKLRVFEHI